jgi:gamma-glutamyltranspeptidase/glutathione hydrolase
VHQPTSSIAARAVVATPHHLATAAGRDVLAAGGNAVDAAIAANLALGIVAPYCCGPGGDLFAIVWDGRAHGYLGAGRAPAAVTRDALAAEVPSMPFFGPHSVTVPGAVDGWFALLERWGTRSFGELAAAAIRIADEGYTVSEHCAREFVHSRPWFREFTPWTAHYGAVDAGTHFLQPASGRTLRTLADDGPDAFYRGPIGAAVAESVQDAGGHLAPDDLAAHAGEWCDPYAARFRDLEILELPPPTQGATVLEALRILDGFPVPTDHAARTHIQIEIVKAALADRDAWISDPDHMPVRASALFADDYVAVRRAAVDPDRASDPAPGHPQPGGTAYLCAADADGLMISLIQSNFAGFGSGVFVPDWGINLHNRGGSFSLDPARINVFAPAKRPLHTLIPALALRDGRPAIVFGTMGGDAQAQVHVQLLSHLVDEGCTPTETLERARWRLDPYTWRLHVEARADASRALVEELVTRGHEVREAPAWDSAMGHAHVIRVDGDGYVAASDPRSEGAALGV